MTMLRGPRSLVAFCSVGTLHFRKTPSPTRQLVTSQIAIPSVRSSGLCPIITASQQRASVLGRTALFFQKPPKGGSGGGGGFFGRFGGSGWGGGGGDEDASFFARLTALYMQALARRPVLTKATSTLVLGLAGDYCAQRIAARGEDRFEINLRRSASVGLWSFCFMGPVLHYWFGALDRVFFGKFSVLYKLLSDQLLFAPFFNSAFIAGVGTLEGVQNVGQSVKEKIWPSMKANWMLWPAAQTINFALVPKHWQMLYVNFVGLAWNIIITYITHQSKTPAIRNQSVAKEA